MFKAENARMVALAVVIMLGLVASGDAHAAPWGACAGEAPVAQRSV